MFDKIKYTIASHFVDPQKGFTPLCPDELPVVGGDEITEALNLQLQLAEIHTCSKDAHNRNALWVANDKVGVNKKAQFDPVEPRGNNVDIHWNAHCIVGEKGFELLDDIPPVTAYDYFVWKGMELDMHPYSSCYHDLDKHMSTGLIEFYEQSNVDVIIVGGLATDYCVLETVKDLSTYYTHTKPVEIIVNLEGCRGVAPKTTYEAIEEMMTMENVHVKKTFNEVKDMFR